MKLSAALLSLALLFCSSALAQSSPAEMISNFRIKHGEGRVTSDATLDRIALDQAKAMAAKDTLSHEVLGSFGSRISPAGAGRAGENIAYGYDGFEKTLDQWINSPEHRRNLLLHNASRIGVASVRSETSHRTYWAMEIAGDYSSRTASRNSPRTGSKKKIVSPAEKETAARSCHLKLLGVCF
jgi:Cysteine-rich secretory protein family